MKKVIASIITIVLVLACAVIVKLIFDNNSLKTQNIGLNEKLKSLETTDNGVMANGKLKVVGNKLCNSKGEPIVLRGLSTHGIGWYPRYTNAAAMHTLKEYGANVIRLAVYSDQDEGYVVNSEKIDNYLFNAIENALLEDMYVIVDWHILKDENPMIHIKKAKEFFKKISEQYEDNPAIIYEICNEPGKNTEWKSIKKYSSEIIPLIRKNAPNSIVLVGSPNHCIDIEKPLKSPLKFDNIMYSFHAYVDVVTKKKYELEWLESKLDTDIPLFVSEWGLTDESEDDGEVSGDNAVEFMQMMDERGLSWCNWSLSNKDEFYSAIKSDCEKYSGWTLDDLTFSGRLIFEKLQEQKK